MRFKIAVFVLFLASFAEAQIGPIIMPPGGAGGGDALTSNPLSQFAATTCAQFAGVITSETGTCGSVVLSTAPTFGGTVTFGTISSNTGILKMFHASNAFYTQFTNSATQDADAAYILPVNDGAANEFLKTDGAGLLSWATPSSTLTAGTATSGGTVNSLVYNDASGNVAFGGAPAPTWAGTAGKGLVFGAGTATTDVQALSTTQTWNNAGVTFTGIKSNVTDTASNAASLLMDLQVGGTSKFSANKGGALIATSGVFTSGIAVGTGATTGHASSSQINAVNSGTQFSSINTSGFINKSDMYHAWTSSSSSQGSQDLYISREGAAILQMGLDVNGSAVAQTFKAHDGITGTDIAGANLTIAGGRGTGTGAGGNRIDQTSRELGTGTTAQTLQDRTVIVAKAKALTAAAATQVVLINVASGAFGGGTLEYTVQASDATDHQARAGRINWAVVNKAGTETCTVSAASELLDGSILAESAGASTLTYAITADTSATNGCYISFNAVSSLTETVLNIAYRITGNGGTSTFTAQ